MDKEISLPVPGRRIRKIADAHGNPINPEAIVTAPEPEPRQLTDSDMFDHIDDAVASMDRARQMALHMTLANSALNREIKILKTAADRANKNVFKYGEHLSDCSWHDLVSSGRILRDLVAEDHCSCGWVALKTRLEDELAKEDTDG